MEEKGLRTAQVATLSEIDVNLVEVTLAAMDAIIDKGGGTLESDVQRELNDGTENLREHLKELSAIAETGEEKRLIYGMIRDYPAYEITSIL